MIPVAQITHWRQSASWAADHDVEQDLVISRAVVEIFNTPYLRDRLAFRGHRAAQVRPQRACGLRLAI